MRRHHLKIDLPFEVDAQGVEHNENEWCKLNGGHRLSGITLWWGVTGEKTFLPNYKFREKNSPSFHTLSLSLYLKLESNHNLKDIIYEN